MNATTPTWETWRHEVSEDYRTWTAKATGLTLEQCRAIDARHDTGLDYRFVPEWAEPHGTCKDCGTPYAWTPDGTERVIGTPTNCYGCGWFPA